MNEKKLIIILTKALDLIGAELRIWKEDFFGKKPEKELIEKLAHKIVEINEE